MRTAYQCSTILIAILLSDYHLTSMWSLFQGWKLIFVLLLLIKPSDFFNSTHVESWILTKHHMKTHRFLPTFYLSFFDLILIQLSLFFKFVSNVIVILLLINFDLPFLPLFLLVLLGLGDWLYHLVLFVKFRIIWIKFNVSWWFHMLLQYQLLC